MESAVYEELFWDYLSRSAHNSSLLTPDNTPAECVGSAARKHVTSYFKRFTGYTPAFGGQVKKNQLLQGQDAWAFLHEYHNLINAQHPDVVPFLGYCYQPRNNYVTRYVELVTATVLERMLCLEYVKGGGLDKHIQNELCDRVWATRYKIIKGNCEGINHLHGAQDHFAKAVRESVGKLIDELIAAHDKNREGQLLHVLGVYGIGGAGKTSLVRDLFWDLYSPTMFQNIDSKTLVCRVFKDLGTEGVNFSVTVTDSSLETGGVLPSRDFKLSFYDPWKNYRRRLVSTYTMAADASGSPEMVLDSGANSRSTGGLLNPLLGLHRVDPVSVPNEHRDFMENLRRYCRLLSLLVNCSKAEMKKTRHRVRKSRHNKGRRMVSRRCSSQKNPRGVVSRSEPISADNSSLLTPDTTPKRSWRIASAAQQHMTGYLKYLTDYTPASGDQVIDTPTKGRMPFHGRGSVNTKNMTLRDVLYVPGLEANLVSTGQLAELGYTISIGPYGCHVYKDDEGVDLVGKAHYVDGYLLELDFLRV